MSTETMMIRNARIDERNELKALHRSALRQLSFGFLTRAPVESFIQHVETLDAYLLSDRTYYVISIDGRTAACGGWSLRMPGYSAIAQDAIGAHDESVPTIRAMFVNPAFARRGLGRRLLGYIEGVIASRGFRRATLTATPMGRPLYERCGWKTCEGTTLVLPDGRSIDVFNMEKHFAGGLDAPWSRQAA